MSASEWGILRFRGYSPTRPSCYFSVVSFWGLVVSPYCAIKPECGSPSCLLLSCLVWVFFSSSTNSASGCCTIPNKPSPFVASSPKFPTAHPMVGASVCGCYRPQKESDGKFTSPTAPHSHTRSPLNPRLTSKSTHRKTPSLSLNPSTHARCHPNHRVAPLFDSCQPLPHKSGKSFLPTDESPPYARKMGG